MTKAQMRLIKRFAKNPLGCMDIDECIECELNSLKGNQRATSYTCMFYHEVVELPYDIERGIHITCKKVYKLELLKEIMK